jgi:hypothetical protein
MRIEIYQDKTRIGGIDDYDYPPRAGEFIIIEGLKKQFKVISVCHNLTPIRHKNHSMSVYVEEIYVNNT